MTDIDGKMELANREEIEWTNTWIDYAFDTKRRRILLLGDSVARQYRGRLRKQLEGTAIDFIGCSFSLEDPMLYRTLDCFFANHEYVYDMLLLNLGGKHGYYLKTLDDEEDARRYGVAYEHLLEYLLPRFPKTAVLLTTPNVRHKDHGKWDEEVNREIMRRNDITAQAAKAHALPVVDLYSLCYDGKFKYSDRQHLLDEDEYFKLTDYLCGQLKNCGFLDGYAIRPIPRVSGWKKFWRKLFSKSKKREE